MEVVSCETSWPAAPVTPLDGVSVQQTASSARLAGGAANTSAKQRAPAKNKNTRCTIHLKCVQPVMLANLLPLLKSPSSEFPTKCTLRKTQSGNEIVQKYLLTES